MTHNCSLSYFEAIFAIMFIDLVTPLLNPFRSNQSPVIDCSNFRSNFCFESVVMPVKMVENCRKIYHFKA